MSDKPEVLYASPITLEEYLAEDHTPLSDEQAKRLLEALEAGDFDNFVLGED